MKISIFGLGYVGCVSMGCLAKNGHEVIGVDLDPIKVEFINNGKSTIVEKDIDKYIAEQRGEGNITATIDAVQAVVETDLSFICVGTPSTQTGHLDLSSVFRVAEQIGEGIRKKGAFHIVVIRSTVVPGTNKKVVKKLGEVSGKSRNIDFSVVSNPEFLREGSAVMDFFNPPFTLIGCDSEYAEQKLRDVYAGIEAQIIVSDIEIAEMVKYVNNAFHALKITFANEVGNICRKLGIDSHRLMEIFCMDEKLNLSSCYFKPGFAYGGSCLPKDLKALKTMSRDLYVECPVIESVEKSNEVQKRTALEQILEFGKRKIGFLGLSFKAGTDDLRNSPIIDLLEQLLGKGFDVQVYDRNVHLAQLRGANREYILKKIPFISKFISSDLEKVLDHSEVIVVVNKEMEFAEALKGVPSYKIIYDLVNIDFPGKKERDKYIGISW